MLRQLRRCCVVGSCAEDLATHCCQLTCFTLFSSRPYPLSLQPPPPSPGEKCTRTGNTTGTPPLTALLPSVFAASLSHSFSAPFASFQLMIVAPKSSTSMLSPVGSTADTRLFECEMVTCACGGRPGVADSAEGFFGRSTMVRRGRGE